MRFRNKMLAITGAVVASFSWGLWHGTVVGQAVTTDPQSVLNSAPQSLKVAGNSYFNKPDTIGSGTSQISNAAQILTGSKGDGVSLTQDGAANTGGAIWSNGKSFNMYKNQRASMWVYIGTNGATPGDGIAFVLQNSSNSAFSGTGESLGVWGVDPRKAGSTTTDLQNSAIQKSWALEFDTGVDQTVPAKNWIVNQTDPNSFDIGQYTANDDGTNPVFNGIGYNPGSGNDDINETIKGEHIASNYPDMNTSYYAYPQAGKFFTGYGGIFNIPQYSYGTYNYFGLAHRGLIRDNSGDRFMSLGNWQHITLDYTAPTDGGNTGTITYSYNDKDATTGAPKPQNNNTYARESIDLSNLDVSESDPNVYWGFTGTTGTNSETSVVAFEQVPGQANVNSTATLTDETKNNATITSGYGVSGNDAVKATYTLNYESGEEDWSNIKSSLNLPANINWNKAEISYPNSTTATKSLSPADISNNKLDVNVDNLNSSNNQAVITLEGTANNVAATSATAVSSFVGDNAITSAKTNSFKITASPFTVSLSPKTIAANANTATTVKGSVSSTDSTVTGSNTTLTATMTAPDGTVTDIAAKDIDLSTTANAAGGYDFTVNIDKVLAGSSTVQVSAKSSSYSASDTATVTGGTVDFGDTSGAMTFETTTLSGSGTQTVPRDESNGAWRLDVDSSLIAGSSWKVTAKTAGMYNDNVPDSELDGALIYKNAAGTTTLNSDDGTVVSSDTTDGTANSTNIASDWTSNSGILLNVNGGAVNGSYTGTIDWTLELAP
ncbi:L-type lectin family protein [Levilactobacillus fujinensis]|uniref:Cell surface protein n=1 Tax=Levilactobacillus fujinensis TaxID=2486024 RepID=A0ABW1TI41_9LACO|nr:hypothetical protein [Levilactobacillus fujinensis]